MGSSEEDSVVPPVPEPLKIFGKEFEGHPGHTEYSSCRVGVIHFAVLDKGTSGLFGSVDCGVMNGPFRTSGELLEWMESEGRRIAREMLMMAGEMVAEEPIFGYPKDCTGRITHQMPVRFKDQEP